MVNNDDNQSIDDNNIDNLNEYKKFWTSVLRNGKEKFSHQRTVIYKLELIINFLALITILISQIEYESQYYPTFYDNTKNINLYQGNNVRISISCLLAILSN